jgi:hypothetical protein
VTATVRTAPPPNAAAPAAPAPRKSRSWRWLRLAIPLAVAVLILSYTAIAHAIQTPDITDKNFLNPDSPAATGGADLAGRLHAGGIEVDRVTSTVDALREAFAGDTTLFIPEPSFANRSYLAVLDELPATSEVVMVAPNAATLRAALIQVGASQDRWATGRAEPGCAQPDAVRAGTAGIVLTRYWKVDRQTDRCYDGALIGMGLGRSNLTLAGASDPFRNDRIGELHNAALAVGLLSHRPRVVWLDLHRPEPPPALPPEASQVDPNGTGNPPTTPYPSRNGGGGGGGGNGGSGNNSGQNGSTAPNPLWSAFPLWMWLVLILLLLIGLVLAFAFGRRLGPPVTEPLPVVVRAAETTEGRGRLYRRAKARGPALDALRVAARHRLLPALGLEPDTPRGRLVDEVAARSGYHRNRVDSILYGYQPDNDESLVYAANELDALLYDALRDVDPATAGAGRDNYQGEAR